MDTVTDLISDLVEIESINPELVPGGVGEVRIARFVANWLEDAGLEVSIEEAGPGRPNVIGVLRGTGDGKRLMLNAHMDTVGVEGMARPFSPYVEDGRLYGRGAYDMKGSLAAIMLAVKQVIANPPRGDVIVTAVCDEEYASVGTQAVARKWKADAALITEPTELQTCIAHRGFVWLRMTTRGHAAHGSRYDLGIDAIAKMGKFLVALEKHGLELVSNPMHPLLESGSIHASVISGGQELSSYPAYCTLDLERRTLPGEDWASVVAQLEDLMDEIRVRDGEFDPVLEVLLEQPAFEIEPDDPFVLTVQEQATSILGAAPELVGVPFWMDSALLDAAGIPTVIFGPAGGGAHAIQEWVELDSVEKCIEVYTQVIQDFCNQ